MPSPLPLLFLWTMYQKACLNFDHIIWFVDSLSLFKDEPGNYHARKDIPNHHWCMMQVCHIMLIMLYMIFCLRRPFEVPLCFRVHDVEIQFSIVLCLQYRKSKIVNVNSLSHLDSSKTLSEFIAEKVAASGLCFQHLKTSFGRNACTDLEAI